MFSTTLAQIAAALKALAAIFDPKDADSISDLLDTAAQLNETIAEIRAQTEETAPEVWKKIAAHSSGSYDRFVASVAAHPGK